MNPDGLRTAVYERLNVSAIVSLLSGAYGAEVPIWAYRAPQAADSEDPARFPYITFSVPSDVYFGDKGAVGDNAIIQVDIWSRGTASGLEAIAKAVHTRLHKTAWTLPGFVEAIVEGMDITQDPDGQTRRALIRCRVIALPDAM